VKQLRVGSRVILSGSWRNYAAAEGQVPGLGGGRNLYLYFENASMLRSYTNPPSLEEVENPGVLRPMWIGNPPGR
jgi:hypothetical protein